LSRFPADTRDAIEKLYAARILSCFPNYAEFWEKLIGVRDSQGALLPYRLRIPRAIAREERSKIERAYEEIAMAHYTLFCNLAGAHFQKERLQAIAAPSSTSLRWFKHWEAFESVYLHLGIAFYEVYHLWDLLFLLRGQLGRARDGSIKKIPNGLNSWQLREREFRDHRKLMTWHAFQHLNNEITARRNNITHYSRGAFRIIADQIYVPQRIRPNAPWHLEIAAKNYWETRAKAAMDLEKTERAINSTHGLLTKEYEDYFSTQSIRFLR